MSRENGEGGQQPNWKNKKDRVFGADEGRQKAKANESADHREYNEKTKGEGVVKIRKFLAELFKKTEKINFTELENYLNWVTNAYESYIVYKKAKDGGLSLDKEELEKVKGIVLTGGEGNSIKMLTSLSGGAGGQNVQKNESRVQAFHLPTGLMAVSQDERSPEQNKRNAKGYLFEMVVKHLDFLKKTVRGDEALSVTLERLCNESFGDEYRMLSSKEMSVVDLLWEDKFDSVPKILKAEKKNPPQI